MSNTASTRANDIGIPVDRSCVPEFTPTPTRARQDGFGLAALGHAERIHRKDRSTDSVEGVPCECPPNRVPFTTRLHAEHPLMGPHPTD